ncbi:MAG TPA: TIM barrel protein [Bryobacteraceae bacterium]|nr:TIM barrel protein [Bryobacteraceae bacterium]
MSHTWSRRGFVFAGGALALSSAQSRPIRLGGPVFLKTQDPRELAREHRRLGYSAAYCPDAKPDDTARTREIEQAFAAENVVIAEVGAWYNMLDPDAAKRRENLAKVVSRLALAEAVGARCCVDIAGSYNPDSWFGPHKNNFSKEFFDATVENCRRVIDEIRPKRARFAIEMMGWAIPDGPESYRKLVKAVDRKAFGVHIDVCNGVNSPARYYHNAAFITECFRTLGPWVVSCHAKDLEWKVEMNVHFVEVVPGRGGIHYRTYLREIANLPVEAPLMLEHLSKPEEYEEGKRYIQGVARELGLPFA